MTDITMIVEAVFGLIMALTAIFIVPKLTATLKSTLNEAEMKALKEAIVIAVRAAEQIYKLAPKSGVTKKQYVLDYLAKQGYTVDMAEVSALIEATVNELFPTSNIKEVE